MIIKEYIDNNIKDWSSDISLHEYIKSIMYENKDDVYKIIESKLKKSNVDSISEYFVKDIVSRSWNEKINWIWQEYREMNVQLNEMKRTQDKYENFVKKIDDILLKLSDIAKDMWKEWEKICKSISKIIEDEEKKEEQSEKENK